MTWIYIICSLVIFIIVLFYISLSENTNSYTIYKPTKSIIDNLFAKYPNTLRCPCDSYSMHFDKFITVKLSFHQICSSQFSSSNFIHQLWIFNNTNSHPYDFVSMTGSYFSTISTFCNVFTSLVLYSLNRFQVSLFSAAHVPSSSDFQNQAEKLLNIFKSQISSTSTVLHDHIFDIQAIYQPLPITVSAFSLRVTSNDSILVEPNLLDNCSCLTDWKSCSTQAGLYTYDSMNSSFTLSAPVEGVKISCLPTLSLLQSSFACWYSYDCYQRVSYIDSFRRDQVSFFEPLE